MNNLAETAIGLGLPCFPCAENKSPCWSKKEGGNGFLDATTDKTEIIRLFSHRNAHLIGVPTGDVSSFDVLDLDYRHGAAEWEQANLHRLPETRIHGTRSGGRHYFFHHAPGIRNTASQIGPGVDTRGEGGFIVHWASHGVPVVSDAPIAHWPDWLLPMALPKPKATGVRPDGLVGRAPSSQEVERIISRALSRVRNAGEGRKHYELRNAALLIGGVLANSNLTEAGAIGALLAALPDTVQDWENARATALWGLQEGAKRPIEVAGSAVDDLTDEEREALDEASKALAKVAFRLAMARADRMLVEARLVALDGGSPVKIGPSKIAKLVSWAFTKSRAA